MKVPFPTSGPFPEVKDQSPLNVLFMKVPCADPSPQSKVVAPPFKVLTVPEKK